MAAVLTRFFSHSALPTISSEPLWIPKKIFVEGLMLQANNRAGSHVGVHRPASALGPEYAGLSRVYGDPPDRVK